MQEAEFTAAMHRAVASRGADYRYPRATDAPAGYYTGPSGVCHTGPSDVCPTYSTKDGEATCLIAVAMLEAGMGVPHHSTIKAADSLLIHMGAVSKEVALAARCAQIHQDYNNPWGEALAVYETALNLQASGERFYSIFTTRDLYQRAAEIVTGKPSTVGTGMQYGLIDIQAQMQKINEAKANLAEAFASLAKPCKEVAAALPMIPTSFDGTTEPEVAIPEVKPLAKGGWVAPSEVINLSDIYSPNMYGGNVTMTPMATLPEFTWTGSMIKKEHALIA